MSATPNLHGLDPDSLLAAGLEAPPVLPQTAWEAPAVEDLRGVLPGYEMVRLIGRGGMGAVYEARQVHLGRRVAVKILPAELSANEAFAERFRREARTLGSLEHANILEVFDFGESAAGHLFYSMPCVDGGDLGARLKSGPLPQGEALRLVREICAALEAAHAQGVIHRDIKPSNILLTAEGTVKVADFGIAVLDDQPRERLTHTGVAVGTMEYIAPEQAAGTAVDTRSDLYSVGVICYEVLTGKLPRGIFDPPSKVNAAVSPSVDPVVHTAMQSDPARRFQSASEFHAALNRTGAALMPPKRRRGPMLAACAVIGALGCGSGLMWWKGNQPPPKGAPAGASPVSGRELIGWGQNNFGQGTTRTNAGELLAIGAGDEFNAVLKSDGTVAAWGRKDKGQTRVPADLKDVMAISVGSYHVLALKTDGTVVAWGSNDEGQSQVPDGLSGVQAVSAGAVFSMALKRDGTVVAWGSDTSGQCRVPPGLNGVRSIAAGYGTAFAVKDDGSVAAWGYTTGSATLPSGLAGVRSIAAGWHHFLALKTDGTVLAWGRDTDGQTLVPSGLNDVQAVAAGFKHSMALKSDGTVVAWGIPGQSEWGDAAGQTEVPAGLSGVRFIAAGQRHSLALKQAAAVRTEWTRLHGQE